jgi:hypothetical protein
MLFKVLATHGLSIMSDLHSDLEKLLAAAKNAIEVLRHNAEQHQIAGQSDSAERDAIRRLNMAVQVIEYDLHGTDKPVDPTDWQRQM